MEAVFDPPVRTDDRVETLGGHRLTEQVIGCLDGGFGGRFRRAGDLADALQAGPLAIALKSADVVRDGGLAGLDPSVVGIDGGIDIAGFARGIVEEQADIRMQGGLIALQRQGVIAAAIDDLLGDGALAVERVDGHDRALERQHLQQLRHRGDLVGLLVGGDLRQHHTLFAAPGAHHMQCRFLARPVERAAQNFAVDRDNTLTGLGKRGHEALKCGAEPIRIEGAKQEVRFVWLYDA